MSKVQARAREFGPADNPAARIALSIGCALVLCLAIWETAGRPQLKAEVERLKNR